MQTFATFLGNNDKKKKSVHAQYRHDGVLKKYVWLVDSAMWNTQIQRVVCVHTHACVYVQSQRVALQGLRS